MLWKTVQFRPNERPFSFDYQKYRPYDVSISFQMIDQIRSFWPFLYPKDRSIIVLLAVHFGGSLILEYLPLWPKTVYFGHDPEDQNLTFWIQFLLTDDFRVVLNDVDELIAAGADGKVRCNCNIIRGGSEFDENGERPGGCLVPPEQKQCGTNIYYTEKIDIWKIPDITRAIIGDSPEGLSVWDELHRLHQECKNSNPNMRPPIEYVVDKYKQLQYKMQIPSYHWRNFKTEQMYIVKCSTR